MKRAKRTKTVRVCVTKTERAVMQAAADLAGVTLSEWIRRMCSGRVRR